METWKCSSLAPDYQVSDAGRVRRATASSVPNQSFIGRERSIYLDRKGYARVSCQSNGKKRCFQVHRLVAHAFLGASDSGVNHKNGIKHDNRLSNLEYATSKENSQHAYWVLGAGPHSEQHHNAKLTAADVARIWALRDEGLTTYQIAPLIGCTRANICYILRGKAWARVSAKLGRIVLPTHS